MTALILKAQYSQKYRRLIVWNQSMELIEAIYKLTSRFPGTEIYGLTNQLRRSCVSIALNIAEGSGAGSDLEYRRFLNIARRSAFEALCGLEVAQRLKFCAVEDVAGISKKCDQISAMLSSLSKKMSSTPKPKADS